MKILIIGKNISKNSYGDNINFVMPLIELGHDLKTYDLESDTNLNSVKITNIIIQYEPNLIFFIPVEDEIDLTFVKEISKKTITVTYFYDDTWRIKYSLKWADSVTYIITSDINWRLNFEYIKHKIIFSPFFVNCKEYRDNEIINKLFEVSFVGQYHPYREWLVNKIRESGINVKVFGYGWSENSSISFNEMINVFNNSKINLNLSNCVSFDIRQLFDFKSNTFIGFLKSIKLVLTSFYKSDMKLYEMVKARFFEINSCSGFQIGFYAQGLEKVYEIGQEIEIFSTTDELIKKIKFYLENDSERLKIAKQGYLRTLREHDAKLRLDKIISSIDFDILELN
jgi:spore maturation protein CgeB